MPKERIGMVQRSRGSISVSRVAPDHVSATITVEALASVIDPREITDVLQATDAQSKRLRKLPATLVVWLVIGMALFRDLSIMNVLHRLVRGLGMDLPWKDAPEMAPTSKAVTKARDRLGYKALRLLFQRLAVLFRREHADQNLWRGHPVYGVDGTNFTVPDTEDNVSHFGRPGGGRGTAGYPQVRATFLVALWSHIVCAAAFGPLWSGELTNAGFLLAQVEANALLLLDRLYFAYAFLLGVTRSKAHFLVRAKVGKRTMPLYRKRSLGKDDWLGELRMPKYLRKRQDMASLPRSLVVRIVRYRRKGFRPQWLVTTLLDPDAYPVEELVLLYHGRWEIELCYREVKTRFAREQVVFRCQRHERVLQEAYGLLIAYNCVRVLMARAAREADVEPRQLSFTDCLVRVRDAVVIMAVAPGMLLPALYHDLLADLARCVLPPRRANRVYPRAVKVKMSKYPIKKRA